MENLSAAEISALSTSQLAALTQAQAAAISAAGGFAELNNAQIKGLNAAAIAAVPADVVDNLSAGDVAMLTNEQLAALSDSQKSAIAIAGGLGALSASQFNTIGISGINSPEQASLLADTLNTTNRVNTFEEVSNLASAVLSVFNAASGATGVPTLAELALLGATTVTDLNEAQAAIRATADDGSEVDSLSELLALAATNNNDEPTGAITLGGALIQGQTLTAVSTLADLDGLGPFSYQWQTAVNNSTIDIPGANAETFTLTQAQVGQIVNVLVTYTDGRGNLERVSSTNTDSVADIDDSGTISTISGTAAQGQTLIAGAITDPDGGVTGITYQWQADGIDISGATSNTVVLSQNEVGKVIRVIATYTDAQGTGKTVTSAVTSAVVNIDDPGSIGAITGTASQGQTLTAGSITDADGGVTGITYQWQADGVDISGATNNTLVLSQNEVGKVIRVIATYTDALGSGKTTVSAVTSAVADIDDAGTIGAIIGTATQGQTLTAGTIADPDGGVTGITYQWQADGINISGATSNSVVLSQNEVGKLIRVIATYTDAQGTGKTVTSAVTSAVVNVDDPGTIGAIVGNATQGQTLTAGAITDPDGGVTGITYQWQADGVNIGGATSNSVVLSQSEVGKAIRVIATYTDALGNGKTATSAVTSAVADIDDPGSIGAITGTATQGQTLTVGAVTDPDGGVTGITYQWQADGVDIGGATNNTLVLSQNEVGKLIRVIATYTDAQGSGKTATSAVTSAVVDIDDAGSISAITGTATQGQTLAAGSITDPDGGVTGITYQWQADGVNISGATNSTLVLSQNEVGKLIRVIATYTDAQGSGKTATSAATSAVVDIDDAGSIGAISGTASQGQTLTAGAVTDSDGGVTGITYQWQADGVNISGATNNTLVLSQNEVGKLIRVIATYTDAEGSGKTATSAVTSAVADIDDAGSIGAITGTATQGQTLTAGAITDPDGGVTGITYQWQADGVNISGATNNTLVLSQNEVGKLIRVIATYTDAQGSGKTATSAVTSAVVDIDDAGSIGAITGTATQGQTLAAGSITDPDGGVTGITYQWQADGVNISGATNNTLVLSQNEVGKLIRVIATYTDAQGSGENGHLGSHQCRGRYRRCRHHRSHYRHCYPRPNLDRRCRHRSRWWGHRHHVSVAGGWRGHQRCDQ